ncbi:hypothetical protein [Synechococcus sp. PCC 6312]|uniref:hypothetical protein n=1 Tax=Synechococcus sp. (strain ATCC 27167 / PCC 6312) TaxID=195253 RepID=UPI00029EC670|nr:hypothetical protein [Synechococcus sp. PCC 6312]AFY62799.1 hypothetical protein Syn6312_3789 [Synechococcus sp. PCC 6312]
MKRKGSIGGNPNPVQTPEFLAKQFPPAPDVPPTVKLGEPICVAVPLPIDAEIRRLKNRSIWLRRVIIEAAQRELMGNAPQAGLEDAKPGLDDPILGTTTKPGAAEVKPKRRVRKPKEA